MRENHRPILLLAETGIVIRNLLLGTFAETLLSRRPLVVAVQNPDHEGLRAVLNGRPLELTRFPRDLAGPPRTRWEQLTSWQTYMYWLKQAQKATTSSKIQSRLHGSRRSALGQAAVQILTLAGRVLKETETMGLLESRYLQSVARWPVTREWTRLLEELRPAAVVSTVLTLATKNRPSRDLPAVVAARGLGIPCGTLVQSWDNLSSKPAVLPPWLDRYWTWSHRMSDELLRLYPGIPCDRIKVVGSPQFDFHRRPELVEPRKEYCERLGFDPDRPVVLIGTGTAVRLPNEPEATLLLVRTLRSAIPPVQSLIRLHPKDDGSRWRSVRAELRAMGAVIQHTAPPVHMDAGGFVPPAEFYKEQINALTHAAVVINAASTLTVDAAILDRPVICVAYDVVHDPRFPEGRAWVFANSSHYAPLVATGGVAVVRSAEQCVRALRAYLEDPGRDREGRRQIVNLVAGPVDGCVGKRLADEVEALIHENGKS